MTIRKATNEDLLHVVRSLQNKKISYNSTKQAKADLAAGNLYIAELPLERGFLRIGQVHPGQIHRIRRGVEDFHPARIIALVVFKIDIDGIDLGKHQRSLVPY